MVRRPIRSQGAARERRWDAAFETMDVRTSDGWSLRADVQEPSHEPVGVAVLAHALMARRSEFGRAPGGGIARFLVERGWRVVAFDFRGHGDSASRANDGAAYGYDDLVTLDLPAVYAFARSRARRGRPVVLVGHSLGGHAGLAAQGAGLVAFDGVVLFAASMWLRELEPSIRRWLVKRALLSAIVSISRRTGRLPARALRVGSDDESCRHVEDFERFSRTGRWGSADGKLNYLEGLRRVRVPVLQVVSEGDRLICPPVCGARFVACCGGPHELLRLTRDDRGAAPPGHMELVTSARVTSAWAQAESFMRRL
jgi:predicted alpha/beta hydrolase